MYFRYFVIISLWKRAGPFIWNLNSLYPSMHCAKFGWNWPSGSGEDDENVKSWRQRQRRQRRTTDKLWSEMLTWAFSSGELKREKDKLISSKCKSTCRCVWYARHSFYSMKTGICFPLCYSYIHEAWQRTQISSFACSFICCKSVKM